MGARSFQFNNSSGVSTSTSTSLTTKASVTFTPANSTTYYAIWQAMLASSSALMPQVKCNLVNTTDSVTLANPLESGDGDDISDYWCTGGLAKYASSASPGSHTFAIQYATNTSGQTIGIQNANLLMVQANTNDQFASTDATSSAYTSTAFTTATTLSFTVPVTGDYLFIYSVEANNSSNDSTKSVQVRVNDGTANWGIRDISGIGQDNAANFSACMNMKKYTLTSGATATFTMQYNADGTNSVLVRNARILALYLGGFDNNYYVESRGAQTNATTSFSTAVMTTPTPLALQHAILHMSFFDADGAVGEAKHTYGATTTALFDQSDPHSTGDPSNWSLLNVTVQTLAASATTFTTQYRNNAQFAGTTKVTEAAIAILQLDASPGTSAVSRTTTGRFAAQWYIESSFSAASTLSNVGIGVDDGRAVKDGGAGTTGSIWWRGNGNVDYNGTTSAYTATTFAVGDTLGLAINIDKGLIWFRTNSGNWNNNGAANPNTGVGGFSISAINKPLKMFVALANATDAITVNFKPTPLTNFPAWGGSSSTTISITGPGSLNLTPQPIGLAFGLLNGALTITGQTLGVGALIALSNGTLTLATSIIGLARGLQKGTLALTGQLFFTSPVLALNPATLNLTPSNIGLKFGLQPSALILTGDPLGTLSIALVQLFAFPLLLSGQFMGTYPVTVNVGDRILLNHFNNLVAPINTVLGTGTGDVGYGQSGLLTQTTYNAPIQFETMQQTVTKLTNHQGTSNPPAALNTYNARITAADVNSLSTIVQSLQPNRFLTGLTSMALISSAVTSTRATSWSTTITATWNVTFADEDHCRWFFNSSGAVRVNLTHPTTAAPDVEFSAFMANKVGTISFNHSATTQAATTPLGTPAALGYYQLTDSLQTIYTATDTSGGAYSADACQIQAKRLSFVGTRGGNGSGVQFVITLTTAHGTLVAGTELFVGYKIATTFLTMTAPTVTLITGF